MFFFIFIFIIYLLLLTSLFSQMSISCTFLIIDFFCDLFSMLLLISCKCSWIIFNGIIFFSVRWFAIFELIITWLITNIVQRDVLFTIFTSCCTQIRITNLGKLATFHCTTCIEETCTFWNVAIRCLSFLFLWPIKATIWLIFISVLFNFVCILLGILFGRFRFFCCFCHY